MVFVGTLPPFHEAKSDSSFGWMAATLCALVSVRQAAPGSPPIGSLIDYAAFFWAEGIIAVSLVAAVFAGYRAESPARKPGKAGNLRGVGDGGRNLERP